MSHTFTQLLGDTFVYSYAFILLEINILYWKEKIITIRLWLDRILWLQNNHFIWAWKNVQSCSNIFHTLCNNIFFRFRKIKGPFLERYQPMINVWVMLCHANFGLLIPEVMKTKVVAALGLISSWFYFINHYFIEKIMLA